MLYIQGMYHAQDISECLLRLCRACTQRGSMARVPDKEVTAAGQYGAAWPLLP